MSLFCNCTTKPLIPPKISQERINELEKERKARFRIKDNMDGTYEIQEHRKPRISINNSYEWVSIVYYYKGTSIEQVRREFEEYKKIPEPKEPKYYY